MKARRRFLHSFLKNITASLMTGEILGKRYRRQDEIGTPFCVTYDFESEQDHAVTVRFRDSMEQVRISIDELEAYFADKFDF